MEAGKPIDWVFLDENTKQIGSKRCLGRQKRIGSLAQWQSN
jgi:hypothetical protein